MGEEVRNAINKLLSNLTDLGDINDALTDDQLQQRAKIIEEIEAALDEIQCQVSKVDTLEHNLNEIIQSINQHFNKLNEHIQQDKYTKEEIKKMQITSEMHSAQIQQISGELTEVRKVINEISDKFDLITNNTTLLYTKTQDQIQTINTTIYEHIQNIVQLTSKYEEQVNKVKQQMFDFMIDDFMPQFSEKFFDMVGSRIATLGQAELKKQEIELERKTINWNGIITQILVNALATGGIVYLLLQLIVK